MPFATDVALCLYNKIFSATAFVQLEVRAENVGKYGQQSLLECVYIHSQEAEGGKLVWVEWKKEGVEEALLSFYKGSTTAESGYSFAEPSWNTTNRNVSLLITSTSVKDQGEYTCNVMTESGDGIKNTRLKVTGETLQPWLTTALEHFENYLAQQ